MEITTSYVISQIATVFVYIFLSFTYRVKNRKLILAFSLTSNLLNALAFALLGAYTSSVICGISILRDIVFFIDENIYGKNNKITKKDIIILLMIYAVNLIAVIITYSGPLTILYTTGSSIYTYSIWQKNNKLYRFLGILVTVIVIVDSILIKSIFGVLLQLIVFITSVTGYVKILKDEKKNQ